MNAAYELDPDELLDVVERLARFSGRVEAALESADRHVNQLHAEWTGAAAETHRAAHAQWRRGAQELHEALGKMRAIAEGAHGNYRGAASANTAMWSI